MINNGTEEKLDTIGRDEIIDNILNIVESVSLNKGNTTFAIDGLWGCGKTFVLEKLENRLSEIQNEETADNRYFIIHYNSWKYDYYEEPLIAIVSAIVSALDEDKIIKDVKVRIAVKEVFKQIGFALLNLANLSVKKITGVDIKEKTTTAIANVKKTKEDTKDKVKDINKYDGYFDLKNLLVQLKENLNRLSEKYTIVFAVDELDRCLPEYAIKVLERLHHLTEDVSNIVTVVVIDKSKLKMTIKKTFGFDEDSDCVKYLKKFIKFSMKLGAGESLENVKIKYEKYFGLFENQLFKEDNIDFMEFFNALFGRFDIREQELLIEKALMVHQLITKNVCDKCLMYLELIFILFEHRLGKKNFQFFDGSDFCEDLPSEFIPKYITRLNDVFDAMYMTRYDENKMYYSANETSGTKGFVLWVLSCLRAEQLNDKFYKIRYRPGFLKTEQKDQIMKHISKFREFLGVVSE